MKYGPEGATKKQAARHRSYCKRHGEMSWEEYITKPRLRGERKVKPLRNPLHRLLEKAKLWAKLIAG